MDPRRKEFVRRIWRRVHSRWNFSIETKSELKQNRWSRNYQENHQFSTKLKTSSFHVLYRYGSQRENFKFRESRSYNDSVGLWISISIFTNLEFFFSLKMFLHQAAGILSLSRNYKNFDLAFKIFFTTRCAITSKIEVFPLHSFKLVVRFYRTLNVSVKMTKMFEV